MKIRHDWTLTEITNLYNLPLLDLMSQAASVHRQHHKANEVQVCTLLSVKTGGCPEDCAYCPQSVHYDTGVENHGLMPVTEVAEAAVKAKEAGATRFCMGAAWRDLPDNRDFDHVLEMVQAVSDTGLEVCCTMGMVTAEQAAKLKDAGVYAYNHNLDTGESYYGKIISTRKYQERLDTLKHVRDAGMTICCGGILGMGETDEHRIEMLQTLSSMQPHPESVPINSLVAVAGTPLAQQEKVLIWQVVRMIATARILMPKSMVRLSAGRLDMSQEGQALCFLTGANSIFAGEKLLTTPNPAAGADEELFQLLGIEAREAFKQVDA